MSRYSRERVWTVFIVVCLTCLFITFVRHQYQKSGRVDPLTSITRQFLLAPFLHGIDTIEGWWQRDVASLLRGPALASQNHNLRARIANLMQENRVLTEDADEDVRLRVLLNFKTRDPRNLLPAEVLALKPFAERDSAVFSRGINDRVKLKQPALDENGDLAGQVTDVSSNTCDVLLLTDSLSSVGARVVDQASATPVGSSLPGHAPQSPASPSPNPSTVGICVGDRSDLLQLTDLPPDANVQVGDTVVTSGLGGVYPKDIPIGRVVAVDFDKIRNLKSATVSPFADFNHLQEGFLLQ